MTAGRAYPTSDDLAVAMIPVACEMACLVREWDRESIGSRLDSLSGQELYALVVVLAAMVPDDVPLPGLGSEEDRRRILR